MRCFCGLSISFIAECRPQRSTNSSRPRCLVARLPLKPFDDDIDQRLDFALAVVEMMRHVGEARAAVASFKHDCIGPEHGPDAAGGEMHVFDRPAGWGAKGPARSAARPHSARIHPTAMGTSVPRALRELGWHDVQIKIRRAAGPTIRV